MVNSPLAVGEEETTIPPTASAVPSVVSYTFTRWERFRTLVWMLPRSRIVRIFAACVVPVIVWLAFRNGEGDSLAVKSVAATFELALVFVVGAGSMVLSAFVMAFLTTDRTVTGSITLTFSDDGFSAEGAVGKTYFKWAALQSILVSSGFIYLRISDTKFLGVPKRAFPDAPAAERFAAWLGSRAAVEKRNAST